MLYILYNITSLANGVVEVVLYNITLLANGAVGAVEYNINSLANGDAILCNKTSLANVLLQRYCTT